MVSDAVLLTIVLAAFAWFAFAVGVVLLRSGPRIDALSYRVKNCAVADASRATTRGRSNATQGPAASSASGWAR